MKLAQIVFQLHWCPTFQQVEYTDRSSTDTEVRGTRGFEGDELENVMHNCGSSVIEKIESHEFQWRNLVQYLNSFTTGRSSFPQGAGYIKAAAAFHRQPFAQHHG
ncbi:hypothetical protein CEXT_613101, partial [Caerostris extrusa]